ncbi:MAG: rhomboid family intramembrane serine protease [Cytophagales bacterium]|nr:rhomboid family intramembrane serine protease [Cytophagales bacterium]MDW8384345.1 rhomboid family intramembrane serine protease [Flammeovirgaceae bacterium]
MKNIGESFRIPVTVALLFWSIELLKAVGLDFTSWGIYPRTLKGLFGILFAPFLHGSISHLVSNTPAFILLMAFILFFYRRVAFWVIVGIWFFTGLSVWLFARSSYHIGASGLVYGFASFLFFSGLFRKNIRSLMIAISVYFLYGGMVYGIFPVRGGISWESHLFGALVGMFLAYFFRNQKEQLPSDKKNDPTHLEGYNPLKSKTYKYCFIEKEPTKTFFCRQKDFFDVKL